MIWRVPCKIYPDFYRVHPDFYRVPPCPDFSRVLTWFFSDLQVWNPVFFKLPPWKKPGRSYPKKFSDSTLEKSGRSVSLEKSGFRLNGWLLQSLVFKSKLVKSAVHGKIRLFFFETANRIKPSQRNYLFNTLFNSNNLWLYTLSKQIPLPYGDTRCRVFKREN